MTDVYLFKSTRESGRVNRKLRFGQRYDVGWEVSRLAAQPEQPRVCAQSLLTRPPCRSAAATSVVRQKSAGHAHAAIRSDLCPAFIATGWFTRVPFRKFCDFEQPAQEFGFAKRLRKLITQFLRVWESSDSLAGCTKGVHGCSS